MLFLFCFNWILFWDHGHLLNCVDRKKSVAAGVELRTFFENELTLPLDHLKSDPCARHARKKEDKYFVSGKNLFTWRSKEDPELEGRFPRRAWSPTDSWNGAACKLQPRPEKILKIGFQKEIRTRTCSKESLCLILQYYLTRPKFVNYLSVEVGESFLTHSLLIWARQNG